MSPLVFVTPLAVIAVVSLWLGWMGRLWLFVAWAAFWVAVVVIGASYVFSSTSPFNLIAILAIGMVLFQASVYGGGWIMRRMRSLGDSDD